MFTWMRSIICNTFGFFARTDLSIKFKYKRDEVQHTPQKWHNSFDESFTPKFYYEKLRDEIEREDNITHQRLTWLMTIQGFLIASMTFLLGGPWPPLMEHVGVAFLRKAAIGAVGVIGLLLAALSATGIFASRRAIERVTEEWDVINNQLNIVPNKAPRTFGDAESFVWGGRFAKLIPFVFIVMWLLFLIMYGGVLLYWLRYQHWL